MDRPGALLFDLDGTIVDSRVPYVRSLNDALESVGLPTQPAERLHRYLGPPMHLTLGELGVPEELAGQVTARYRERYARLGLEESVLYDGVRELLERAHAELPLALATSKVQTLAQALLEHLGLRELFAVVVGAGPEVVAEPKRATIARAIVALGEPANPLMIGDRRFDVEGATANGIPTAGVLWGVGSERELREAGAAEIVGTPAQLVTLLGL